VTVLASLARNFFGRLSYDEKWTITVKVAVRTLNVSHLFEQSK